jgi:hypothetical protein
MKFNLLNEKKEVIKTINCAEEEARYYINSGQCDYIEEVKEFEYIEKTELLNLK